MKRALESLFNGYVPCETFQTDRGSHFNNEVVRCVCRAYGVKPHIVAKYSPWVNGLVEGTNKILLGILKRLCLLDLGEEGWRKIEKWEHLPNNWPDHFNTVIFLLNNRILRALDHTPNELFFAMVINTVETGVEAASAAVLMDNIDIQQAYAGQEHFNGYARVVKHGVARKAMFDRRVLESSASEVIFEVGDLVQVLDPKYKKTFLTSKKILLEWSGTLRVKERLLNSYVIKTIYGQELDGEYNSRCLWPLHAPKGSSLEAYEAARRVGASNEEAIVAVGPVLLEEAEPSREEEDVSRQAEETGRRRVDKDEGMWLDEDDDEDGEEEEALIGERIRARRARTQATRPLPGEGGHMR
jgi:hypothetical protein